MTADATVPEHRKPWSIYAAELPDYGDSTKVPSATGVIAWAMGGPPDVPAVWVAMDRGSKVHTALHYLDEKDLHWPSVEKSEEMRQYILAWQAWRQPSDKFLAIEKPLWGSLAGVNYIVRPDRVMERDGHVWIVDIKTKSKQGRMPTADEQKKHALEVAAQRVAVAQRLGPDAAVTGCLYLWPDGAKLVRYGAARDVDNFADILVRWQEAQQQQAVA
jgi:hypothetical protein